MALANANPDADVITFDVSGNPVNTVYIDDGALEIAIGTVLTIDGDLNDDGITDIILSAGVNHHLTVAQGANLTLTGLDLVGGSSFDVAGVPNAPTGEAGANGEHGYGKADIISDDLYLYDFVGVSGEDGAPGENGERGTDGQDRDVQAGAILNYGTLTIVRAGFAMNKAIAGVGGNAGNGGTGGAGGQGGEGVQGDRLSNAGNTEVAPYRTNPGDGGDTFGGDGGDGANGANGGNGGDGGDGGSAAGAIYNAVGATLSMTDVTFGGILTTLYDYTGFENSATGGRGGVPGTGGNGGVGGWGGDGGDTGYSHRVTVVNDEAHHTVTFGGAGDGGSGGHGGNAGNSGAYGRSGDAAGAILNEGMITGTAALFENIATTTDMAAVFQAGLNTPLGGLPGGGGAGGAGDSSSTGSSTPDGDDGDDGDEGADGLGRIVGEDGNASDGILNRGGTDSVTTGSALVFAHAVDLTVAEGGEASFNIIRLGAPGGDITVTWELQPVGAHGVSASDFEGGALPSGEVVLSSPAVYTDAVKTVSFRVATDAFTEGAETFQIVLTGISISGGDVVEGTSTLNGTISEGGVVEPPPGNENAPVIKSNGGGAAASASVAENTTAVTTVAASDDDGDTLTYMILAGGDGALFYLDPFTHALSFKTAPNFEAPADADGNNVYVVTVQVSDGSKVDTQTISVTVTNVAAPTLAGTKGKDTLTGTGEEEIILGEGGKDTLNGMAGADLLNGGRHKDKLIGGDGADAFVFADKLKDKWADSILDFATGVDTIQLDNKIFKKIGKGGALDAKYFDIAKKADSKKDRLLYDKKKGWLIYDEDGSKSKHDGVKVANLGKNLDLDASDFLVI